MSLLTGFNVVRLGQGLAASACGRLLADLGATVACTDPDTATPLAAYLNHGMTVLRDAKTGVTCRSLLKTEPFSATHNGGSLERD